MNDFTEFENIIGYKFNDKTILEEAFTHKSLTKIKKINNQRLEFLGDSILGAIISAYLYKKFPDYSDGDLTRLKSLLVKKETLANLGEKINISKFLKTQFGKDKITKSMLEDSVEAVIGAVFKDSDFNTTYEITTKIFEKYFYNKINNKTFLKTKISHTAKLKEISEKKYQKPPLIKMIKKEGKDNSPLFIMEVTVGEITQRAKGHSKKEAINLASQKILELIEI